MSKYVLAFRGQPDRTPAAEEEQAWGAWFGQLGPSIMVVDAADLDAAAALAAGCPGLADGVDVEVAEVIPS